MNGIRKQVTRLACATVLLAAGALTGGIVASAHATPARESGTHVTVVPSRPTAALGPLINIPQTWNNCGPASVAEVLSYWGIQRTQGQAQAVLRADNEPSGMGPYGVPGYARSLGLRATLGVEGTPTLLKALISNGFPVIVNQRYSIYDRVRHYRPIEAYDDGRAVFVSSDPYGGPGYAISYGDFAAIWSISNNRFMVLYPPGRQAQLDAVLTAAGWNGPRAYRDDARVQQAHMKAGEPQVGRMYGYLNLAWDDVELGRYAPARLELRQAEQHGAKPIVIGWIEDEIHTAR